MSLFTYDGEVPAFSASSACVVCSSTHFTFTSISILFFNIPLIPHLSSIQFHCQYNLLYHRTVWISSRNCKRIKKAPPKERWQALPYASTSTSRPDLNSTISFSSHTVIFSMSLHTSASEYSATASTCSSRKEAKSSIRSCTSFLMAASVKMVCRFSREVFHPRQASHRGNRESGENADRPQSL